MLTEFWMRLAETGNAANRTLDSLVRMARAQARLHLKEEIDEVMANEVIQSVGLMFVRLGQRIDTSIADPRDLVYNEIIQYANTLDSPITFIDAAKHACEASNAIKQYLGGKVWSVRENKKLRNIHDRFTDRGIDNVKVGRGGLAVAVVGLNPLVIVKADRPKSEPREAEQEKHDLGLEKGGSLRSLGSLASDKSDLDNGKSISKVRLSELGDQGDLSKNDAATTGSNNR